MNLRQRAVRLTLVCFLSIVMLNGLSGRVLAAPISQNFLCDMGAVLPAEVVVVSDVSGSMNAEGKIGQARISGASFVSQTLASGDRVSLIVFDDQVETVFTFTYPVSQAVTATLNLPFRGGGTEIGLGLQTAIDLLKASARPAPTTRNIVLMSDGQGWVNPFVLSDARTNGIRIYTIALGADADVSLMRNLASRAAYAYISPKAEELPRIYDAIHRQSLCPDPPPLWFWLLPLTGLAPLIILVWRNRKLAAESWSPATRPNIALPPQQPILPLPEIPLSPPLQITSPLAVAKPRPALVIGLGDFGSDALNSLQDTIHELFPEQSVPFSLVNVKVGPRSEISQRPEQLVKDLTLSASSGSSGHLAIAYIDAREKAYQASTQNLGMIQRVIENEITRLASNAHFLNVYVIGSLAEPAGSGLFKNIAEAGRQASLHCHINIRLAGLLGLMEERNQVLDEFDQRVTTGAAWRELDRLQLVTESKLFGSSDELKSLASSRLFDRVVLISPDRRGEGNLSATSRLEGLSPLLADLILTQQDDLFAGKWDIYAQNAQAQTLKLQAEKKAPYYSSLGAFTTSLPVESLVGVARNRLILAMIERQQAVRDLNWDECVDGLLQGDEIVKTSKGDTDNVMNNPKSTLLISGLAHRQPRVPYDPSRLAVLLSINPEIANEKEALNGIKSLQENGISSQVKLSENALAANFGEDIKRVIDSTDSMVVARAQEHLGWLKSSRQNQVEKFKQLVNVYLQNCLNAFEKNGSPVVAFLTPAEAQKVLQHLAQRIRAHSALISSSPLNVSDHARKQLLERTNQRGGFPSLTTVLWPIILGAIAAALIVGITYFFLPSSEERLLLLAGAMFVVGCARAYWIARAKPRLHQMEIDFVKEEQEKFSHKTKDHVIQEFKGALEDMAVYAERMEKRMAEWLDAITQSQSMAFAQLKEFEAQRALRTKIIVRRYLEDEQFVSELMKKYIGEDIQIASLNRMKWVIDTSQMLVVRADAGKSSVINLFAGHSAFAYMSELAALFATQMRAMRLADVLVEHFKPLDFAKFNLDRAEVMLEFRANEQGRAIGVNWLACEWTNKPQIDEFARSITDEMKRQAPASFMQKQTGLGHPQRCVMMNSIDILSPSGLLPWSAAHEDYKNRSTQTLVNLHVFAEEKNVVINENAIQKLIRRRVQISPSISTLHANPARLRAFCLSAVLGWLKQGEERQSQTYFYYWYIQLPQGTQIRLTQPTENGGSLYTAACNCILRLSENEAEELIREIESAFKLDSNQKTLEEREDLLQEMAHYGMPVSLRNVVEENDRRKEEIVALAQAYAADERRLIVNRGQQPLMAR